MKILKSFVALVITIGFSAEALASFTLNFGQEFSGGTPPSSSTTPWITASFVDNGNGTVNLIISTPHLTGSENISEFFFNFDDSLNVGALTITQIASSGAFSPAAISRGINAFQADGDGLYDVTLGFATGGNAGTVFGAGDSVTYLLSYGSSISASSFGLLSDPRGGHGPFYAAAHVQNTGGGGYSGWISPTGISEYTMVPEPATLVAGALLLVPFGASTIRLLRRKS